MAALEPLVTVDELRDRLKRFHRLKLANLPTPLLDYPRLSDALGGPRLLVKHEDYTGLALGGNKIREFEYSVAPAVQEGYDVLLHGAASQSNQSRVTAAVAARLGLEAVMVGKKDQKSETVNGNFLLTHLYGADVNLIESKEDRDAVIKRLEGEGKRVYDTSTDGYYLRSVSYVDGFIELWGQLQAMDVVPDGLYVCSGVHTHVGLVVGARVLGVDLRIVGISPSPQDDAEDRKHLAGVANTVAGMLDIETTFTEADFESYGAYAGEEYGRMTDAVRDAVLFAARTEGLTLEPVYTGKTFAALIDHIEEGQWKKGQTVVFVHTGGTPAIFAYGEELLK